MNPLCVLSFSLIRVCVHILWSNLPSIQKEEKKIKMKFWVLASQNDLLHGGHLCCKIDSRDIKTTGVHRCVLSSYQYTHSVVRWLLEPHLFIK